MDKKIMMIDVDCAHVYLTNWYGFESFFSTKADNSCQYLVRQITQIKIRPPIKSQF